MPQLLESPGVSIISEMITPALFILASASLVGTALARLSRVVDYFRKLSDEMERSQVASNARHEEILRLVEKRASHAERSISLFYLAVGLFVFTCLLIVVDRALGHRIYWLPVGAAILGALCLLTGSWYMVGECRMAVRQLRMEVGEVWSQIGRERK